MVVPLCKDWVWCSCRHSSTDSQLSARYVAAEVTGQWGARYSSAIQGLLALLAAYEAARLVAAAVQGLGHQLPQNGTRGSCAVPYV